MFSPRGVIWFGFKTKVGYELSIFIPLKTGLGYFPKSANDFEFVVSQKTFLLGPRRGFPNCCFGF